MDNKNENFEFFGFPENVEIELPDKAPPKHSIPGMGGMSMNDVMREMKEMSQMSPEQLEKMLPKEGMEELKEISSSMGLDFNKMLQQSIELTKSLTSGNMEDFIGKMFSDMMGMGNIHCEDDCNGCTDDEDDCVIGHYELADLKYLQPQYFGSVECIEDDNLYEHFIERYGYDSTKYLDPNLGIKESYLTEITANLPLGNVKNLKFMMANNRFIMFFAELDIEDSYGFFVTVVKTENDYALFIPEFRNTFDISSDGKISCFNTKENEALFNIDDNGNAEFEPLSIPSLEFSINFALAPKKRPLISPHQFGTIKNVMPPINNDSMFLKIGNITSNESAEAILLKKDAELDLNETTFPLYVNFNRVVSVDSLQTIASVLFKTDFNSCTLLDYCELKYTNDHRLYIDIDLGEF